MGTDIQPPEVPLEGGDVAEDSAPAAPAPPVAAPTPPAGPAAPVVETATGAPQYDSAQVEQAMGLHRALSDPIGSGEALTRLVQRHGQLPEWFTWDHAVDAMRNYAQFMSEMEQEQDQQGGGATAPVPQQPGMQQPQPDFERALQQHIGPLQQQLQELQQERVSEVGARRAELIENSVEMAAEGLPPAARETLLNNVVYGLRAAMDQGSEIDFSPKAIQSYTQGMLTHLRSMAAMDQQQAIEEHRTIAPQTRATNGQAVGTPVPRGLAGAASRAMEQARTWEAGQG